MAALADGGVLGREAEGVVTHRTQDAVAGAPANVRDHVTERVVQDVAHVQLAGRVRKHLQDVRLLLVRFRGRHLGIRDGERALPLPNFLPLALYGLGVVTLQHGSLNEKASLSRGRGRVMQAARAPLVALLATG
jgi:hypothetical protein